MNEVLDGGKITTTVACGMPDLNALWPSQQWDGYGQDSRLIDLAHVTLQRYGADDWDVSLDEMWCHVLPPGYRSRAQGWKLHVSGTRSSATAVLERSIAVLLRYRCAFKFARSLHHVGLLNSTHYPRGSAGKFLTAYPDDDEHFRGLAEELDQAKAGLEGPRILSDRAYRPGSIVHYGYGAFAGRTVLSNDGAYQAVLESPGGILVEDRRDAWFSPPAGVTLPLNHDVPAAANGAPTAGPPRSVWLGNRFIVREAIRHANRGGVYRATDTQTDAEVVIKEARPYVESYRQGWDVRDALRHEAEMIDLLAPLGIAPCKITLFEQGGNVFLAEELIRGKGLPDWIVEQASSGPGLPWPVARDMIRRLARLLADVHAAGLVLRDLTPNNVLVTPDDQLRIVDLELAAPLGSEAVTAGTPGYVAPEQVAGEPIAAEADLFSLGAISFLLATSNDPSFAEDAPPVRPHRERLEAWLAMVADHSEAARRLAPLILGLMDEEPERRWDLEQVHAFLDTQEHRYSSASHAAAAEINGPRLPAPDEERLIKDGLEYLLVSMTPPQDRLWPSTRDGSITDPCSMHHGAAGVAAVLARAASAYGDERLLDGLRTACAWIERRLPDEPRLLPGLNFGRSGTAWALYDAAQVLGDEPMAQRALALAKRVPIDWPNPDVTHGVAGAGLTQLHLWQATGDTELRTRMEHCADLLLMTATHQATGVIWQVPKSFDSLFAGAIYYGFAHGVAGIAWFLLAAGLATGRDDCLELARAAGETLCAAAQRDGDSAIWRESPNDNVTRMVHWCHGSSGVGTFLIRLWQATREERFRTLAEMAAVAVRRGRWQASSCVCHGLAGNGEFLLDMAAALDELRYRAWAEELAAVISARSAYRQGRIVASDDSGTSVSADYGVGLAGVVAFLLRLRHGGPRMWIADPAAVQAAQC